MTPDDLAKKVRKVIEINERKAIKNEAYFNPLFADQLNTKVPELIDADLLITTTTTTSERGKIKAARIRSDRSGDVLKLGSVLLDGTGVHVHTKLTLVDDLIAFVADEAEESSVKTVEEKEEKKEKRLENVTPKKEEEKPVEHEPEKKPVIVRPAPKKTN